MSNTANPFFMSPVIGVYVNIENVIVNPNKASSEILFTSSTALPIAALVV